MGSNIVIYSFAFIILLAHIYVYYSWFYVYNVQPPAPLNATIILQERIKMRNFSAFILLITTIFMGYLIYSVTSVATTETKTDAP